MSNQPQAPDAEKLLADQITAWRKEVARLNDLIAHAVGAHVADERGDAKEVDDTPMRRAFEQAASEHHNEGALKRGLTSRAGKANPYISFDMNIEWRTWREACEWQSRAAGAPAETPADLACKEALDAYRGKLEAVWQGICDAVEKATGKPCVGEPLDELAAVLASIGAPAETPKPTGHKPPLPEADRLGPLGERLFLVGTLCNYGTACAIATQPAPAPVTDARDGERYREWRDALVKEDDQFLKRVTAALPSETIKRAPTAAEFDAAIDAAMLSANSPREAG